MTKQTKTTQRIVITGGPCSGKTTLIQIIAQKGFTIVPEAARGIIEQEKLKDSDCLPWKNLQKFQDKVTLTQYELEEQCTSGIIFSDRGIIDGHAYCQLDNIVPHPVIEQSGRSRYSNVFLLQLIPNYQTDASRFESPEKAAQIQETILRSYLKFGYNPVIVPVLPPQERAGFILDAIERGRE